MIEVRVDGLDHLTHNLAGLNRAMPEAIAKGLNRAGETLIERERLEMQTKIAGGPVPFTLNAHGQMKAQPRPGRLDTVVFVKRIQAGYLQGPVFGEDYSGLFPGPQAPLSRAGNIIGKKGGLSSIRGKLRSDGEFIGRVKGKATRGRYSGQPFDIFGRWARLPKRPGQPGQLTVVAKNVVNNNREITLRWYEVATDWATRKLPEHIKTELDLVTALYGRRGRA